MHTHVGYLSQPILRHSQVAKRLSLAKQRLKSYPADTLDFLLMDIERPERCTRHAHHCTGDMSGRTLEFFSYSDGLDGKHDAMLDELFARMLRAQQRDGFFAGSDFPGKLIAGFIQYYRLTGDHRALEAGTRLADASIAPYTKLLEKLDPSRPNSIMTMALDDYAQIYSVTYEPRYLNVIKTCMRHIGTFEGAHSHGMLTMLRGLQEIAIATGDMSWNEIPERIRKKVIDEGFQNVMGDICEVFPYSARNEGCSIADWLMLNLNSGFIRSDPAAYAVAENALYNALAHNQVVTGGLSHRSIRPWGYSTEEFQEAWWCCTMNGGLALSSAARHAVSEQEEEIRVNLLIPGVYAFPSCTVSVSTNWPGGSEAIVTVDGNLNKNVVIRIPEGVVHGKIDGTVESDGRRVFRLSGKIGHHLAAWEAQYALKYGALVLAPMCYTWNSMDGVTPEDNTVPEGYIPMRLPSLRCAIVAPEEDENGLLNLPHEPFPEWSFYAEGPGADFSADDATVNVALRFPGGQQRTVRFWPVCMSTSTMAMYSFPVLFSLTK